MQGVYISADNCQKIEEINLDELPQARKCSHYWIKFKDHFGDEIVSEKKNWLEHFQITDSEKGIGRCDLDYTLKIFEPPSVELRDWLEGDIFVEVYRSQPIIVTSKTEEDQTIKDVVLDSNGQPEIEECCIGVSTVANLNSLCILLANET